MFSQHACSNSKASAIIKKRVIESRRKTNNIFFPVLIALCGIFLFLGLDDALSKKANREHGTLIYKVERLHPGRVSAGYHLFFIFKLDNGISVMLFGRKSDSDCKVGERAIIYSKETYWLKRHIYDSYKLENRE